MSSYFPIENSLWYTVGVSPENALKHVAERYISQNPIKPFTFRVFSEEGFYSDHNGRIIIDLEDKLPNASLGQFAYAAAMIWGSDDNEQREISIGCNSPVKMFFGGDEVYKSGVQEEMTRNFFKTVLLKLKKGWNLVLLELKKVASGFGCIIGSVESKWFPVHYMSPFSERRGQAGWIYSEPVNKPCFGSGKMPDHNALEEASGLNWMPSMAYFGEKEKLTNMDRIFGGHSGLYAYAWSTVENKSVPRQCIINGYAQGIIKVWLDGELIVSTASGSFEEKFHLKPGKHDILVETCRLNDNWGFEMSITCSGRQEPLIMPGNIKGAYGAWLYLGTFTQSLEAEKYNVCTLYRMFYDGEKGRYWRTDMPGFVVRPFHEGTNYGKWTYHVGVTLYGLLKAGKVLERKDIEHYVFSHLAECTRLYDTACHEYDIYGYSGILPQLIELKNLDDRGVGSQGGVMLEAYASFREESFLKLARDMIDLIFEGQERLDNGMFYRERKGTVQERTVWLDDLYMMVNYLVQYYKFTGDTRYIDDAARQFLLFKEKNFNSETGVLSHIYDLKFNCPNLVPWGRGNGWALFSLAEILNVLPDEHPRRKDILQFFRQLCEGFLRLQDATTGLWHQILTDSTSYHETSCTAMAVYSFCKGIRKGWILQAEPYAEAVWKGWEGMCRYSIDIFGNVYGVCQGSLYSHDPDYYRSLTWTLNDTHGTGIVMLAAAEVKKLNKYMEEQVNA